MQKYYSRMLRYFVKHQSFSNFVHFGAKWSRVSLDLSSCRGTPSQMGRSMLSIGNWRRISGLR